MKFSIATLALASAVVAQVDSVPSCAKPCIDKAIKANGCDVDDYACACADMDAIANSAAGCVAGACSQDELLATLSAVDEICANLPGTEPTGGSGGSGGYPTKPYPTETEEEGYPTETEGAYPTETEEGYPTETEDAYPTETEAEEGYPTGYTTSTVYSTTIRTVTSCAEEVTDCPAYSTVVTTESVAISTTVCPIETPVYSEAPEETAYPEAPVETSYPEEPVPSAYPTLTTSYAGTGTGGVYPTQTTSQVEVTAGAAVAGSMGGVAAIALAALAAF